MFKLHTERKGEKRGKKCKVQYCKENEMIDYFCEGKTPCNKVLKKNYILSETEIKPHHVRDF